METLKKIYHFMKIGKMRDQLFKLSHKEVFKTIVAQSNKEIGNLRNLVSRTAGIEGNLAEIGVLLGGSAQVILAYKEPQKKLFLIDTFEGIATLNENDPVGWNKDTEYWQSTPQLKNAFEYVKNRFKDEPNVKIIKGYFPQNLPTGFADGKFSFVHIDVDAYDGTKSCLEYFYPKMSVGGIMLFHDYIHLDTPVKKVCDEFFRDKAEKILTLGTSQGYIKKQ